MKKIEVVAAIIYKDGTYFATQRGYGEFEGMWEFPGGKIEPDEPPEVALKREIQEELGIDITIDYFLCTTEYDYPSFHLTMYCYICSIASGEIELREHKSARWLRPEELGSVEWLPADKEIVDKLKMIDFNNISPIQSDFDQIKKLTEDGQEYWSSRDLCNALVQNVDVDITEQK